MTSLKPQLLMVPNQNGDQPEDQSANHLKLLQNMPIGAKCIQKLSKPIRAQPNEQKLYNPKQTPNKNFFELIDFGLIVY